MKQVLLFIALALATQVFSQRLNDTTYRKLSDQDLKDIYLTESTNKKTTGYILLGVSAASTAAAFAIAENASLDELAGPFFLGILGAGTLSLGFIKLSKGARYQGMANMIGNYPDPASHPAQLRMYKSKAAINSWLAWGLLTGGIITTYAINTNGAESDVTRYGGLVISFASLPFFMAASHNKGRVSILTRKEVIPGNPAGPTGYQSFGLGIPLGR